MMSPTSFVTRPLALLLGIVRRLFRSARAAAGFPASVTRHYLSLLLSAVLYVFVKVLRIQPHGYIKVGKVVELQKVIDHLYAQVELYRGVVRELKDDMEAKESDRKMAIKRLKSTKEEIKELNEKLYETRDGDDARVSSEHRLEAARQQEITQGYIVSFSFLVCVLAAVMFQTYVPQGSVLEWKVVMSVGFPVVWMYVGSVSGERADSLGGGKGGVRGSVMLCGMWWLVGFLSGAWVARLE